MFVSIERLNRIFQKDCEIQDKNAILL